jgi:phage-related protein (TIGR01555 family)
LASPEFYEQLYAGDELASRIVNLVPEEALRRWVEWSGLDKDKAKMLSERCHELDVRGAIERTWKWARAYGGAILYMVTDSDSPGTPLGEDEKIICLRDLSRYDLRILSTDVESDLGSPNFGQPRAYYLNVQMGSQYKGYPIHHSRLIRFDGYMVPRRTYIRNGYWHDSILQRLYNVIRNYQSSNDAAASILQDFNVGIYKMKNLANLIAAGKEDVVKRRLELLNFSKSVIRAMALDADEEGFEDLSRNVTGLAELLAQQSNRLVAATDIPHTKLLGESPDGSNATGNSTTSQWYDYIQAEQENYLRPKLKRLLKILFPEHEDLEFKFHKLWQLDEQQEAELRNKQAQTDQIYLSTGVLDPSEVAQSRFGGDEYSPETELDTEAREMGLLSFGSQGGDEEVENADPQASAKEGSQIKEPPTGPQPYKPAAKEEQFKNTALPGAGKKQEPLVSQTMSQPQWSPEFDKPAKPPGMPNRPRTVVDPEKQTDEKKGK